MGHRRQRLTGVLSLSVLLPISVLLLFCRIQARAQSSATGGGLSLLDAIRATLSNHPLIRAQQGQVEISIGSREQASGAFDWISSGSLLHDLTTLPLTAAQQQENALTGNSNADQITRNTSYSIIAPKLFRNGITVTPQFQLGRTTDNITNIGGFNASTLRISVNVQLFRGQGKDAVAAQENSAKAEVEATLLDLNQLISQLMVNTASSYWNLVAARKNLAIAADAEQRANVYLTQVQALVDADHVPRNDLNEVKANLASRSSTRLAAEQQVLASQQQLAVDMGASPQSMAAGAIQPADGFPDGEHTELPSNTPVSLEYYIGQALQRRADYLASRRRTAGAGILVKAARNGLQPQIDLNFSSGYSGLQQGRQFSDFFGAAAGGVQGPNASVGIIYSFPGQNRLAKGAFLRAEGAQIQADAQVQELASTIGSQVVVAAEAVRNAALRLAKARESVVSYQLALTGEREKYGGGIGSIVDILTVEDRLTSALSDQVQAELSYALAIAQFRFATGTLIRPDQPLQNVPVDTFSSLPFVRAPQERP